MRSSSSEMSLVPEAGAVLIQATGIETASALIVAVDDNTVATFAALTARGLSPKLQILVWTHDEADEAIVGGTKEELEQFRERLRDEAAERAAG